MAKAIADPLTSSPVVRTKYGENININFLLVLDVAYLDCIEMLPQCHLRFSQ